MFTYIKELEKQCLEKKQQKANKGYKWDLNHYKSNKKDKDNDNNENKDQ